MTTRSVSPRLAPFKKGAFHLAIQAGVPMIPIVIRNAGDVAPKGDFVFRPATVDVEVLPPVDTSDWRAETVEDHVREVRNMFLRALGQPEEPEPKAKKSAGNRKKAPAKKKTASKSAAKKKSATKKTAAKKAAGNKKPAASAKKKAAPRKAAGKTKAKAARKKAAQARRKAPVAKARPKLRPAD